MDSVYYELSALLNNKMKIHEQCMIWNEFLMNKRNIMHEWFIIWNKYIVEQKKYINAGAYCEGILEPKKSNAWMAHILK